MEHGAVGVEKRGRRLGGPDAVADEHGRESTGHAQRARERDGRAAARLIVG